MERTWEKVCSDKLMETHGRISDACKHGMVLLFVPDPIALEVILTIKSSRLRHVKA